MATTDQKTGVETDFPNAHKDLRVAIEAHDVGLMRSLKVCFPACVKSYDRESHTAEVMPLVKSGHYNGKEWKYTNRPSYRVSVRSVQCGGFTIDVPLYVGDTGWVIASDRDTTHLKEEGALTAAVLSGDRPEALLESSYQQKPEQPVMHDFVRGFFIPDNWGKWEYGRFKDSEEVNIKEGMYIGPSMDTMDENRIDEEVLQELQESDRTKETKDSLAKKLQSGQKYEQKDTSSIVLEKQGKVHLLAKAVDSIVIEDPKSSSISEYEERRYNVTRTSSWLTVSGNTVECNINGKGASQLEVGNEYPQSGNVMIDPDYGVSIRLSDEDSDIMVESRDGVTEIKFIKGTSVVMVLCLKDGNLTVIPRNGPIVNTEGKVSVKSAKDITVVSKSRESHVIVDEHASLKTKGNVNLTTSGATNIHSADKIKIEAAKDLTLFAQGDLAFHSGKNVVVDSGRDLICETISGNINMNVNEGKTGAIKLNGNNIKLKGADSELDIESGVRMSASGKEYSTIGINGGGDTYVSGSKVNIQASEDVSVLDWYRGSVYKGSGEYDKAWQYPERKTKK